MGLKRGFLFVLLLVICSLSACTFDKELPDTYIEGSDFQYMRMGINFFPNFQKGEKGYYFKWNDFVYFLDEKEEKIVPLCNRADCLHDAEMEQEKRENCNAYIPRSDSSGIAWCNGVLYYLDCGGIEDNYNTAALYRIHADGSGKEEIFRWQDAGYRIQQWIIHRDILFYITQSSSYDAENIKTSYTAYAMPLTGDKRFVPYSIYQSPEDGVDMVTLGNPTAYGNHVYFYALGNLTGWDGSEDTWRENVYCKTLEYNINTKETGELHMVGGNPKDSMPKINTFWNDKLIYRVVNHDKGYLDDEPVYSANLDGTDAEIIVTTKQGYAFNSDGKYLYLSNIDLHEMGMDSGAKFYRVYDKNLNEIDYFTVDEEQKYEFPIGLSDRAYQIYYKDSGEFGIMYWDKNAIGSLNGAEITWTRIPYDGSAGQIPD